MPMIESSLHLRSTGPETSADPGGHAGRLMSPAALILIVLACTAVAGCTDQSIDAAPGAIVRLTNDLDSQRDPAIDGDRIVWNNISEESPTIVIYNITTEKTIRIPVHDSGGMQPPQISGDYVVWTDTRDPRSEHSNRAVWLCTISTGERYFITSGTARPDYPAISGDFVVWEDRREKEGHSSMDIYLYNILTEEETAICTAPLSQRRPRIWQDRVVWTDSRNGNYDIYLYNITMGEEKALTGDPGDQMEPYIYKDRVIWTDEASGEMVLFNLTSNTGRVVSGSPSMKTGVSISGDRIVWTDSVFRDSDTPDNDIHLLDLTKGREMLLYPSGCHYQVHPAIAGDYIVWEEGGDIWLFESEPGGTPPPARDTPGFTAIIIIIIILAFSFFLMAWRRIRRR
jgi:TolB protein